MRPPNPFGVEQQSRQLDRQLRQTQIVTLGQPIIYNFSEQKRLNITTFRTNTFQIGIVLSSINFERHGQYLRYPRRT